LGYSSLGLEKGFDRRFKVFGLFELVDRGDGFGESRDRLTILLEFGGGRNGGHDCGGNGDLL
jgi:hypothetical protein